MLRPAIFLALAFVLPGAQAQQVETHGPAASVLSPTSPGASHGVPSSVLSPTPRIGPNGRIFINSRRFRARFGNPRIKHTRREFIPVPIFIPAYPIDGNYVESPDMPVADQYAPEDSRDPDSDALREAYNRGARDALSRYGEHYLDAREKEQARRSADKADKADKKESEDQATGKEVAPDGENASPGPEPDNSPPTIFIFKDGHKLETQNYAILGQTLYDFSTSGMRKIKLSDIDLDATKKANDDLGIPLRLPPSP